MKSSRELLDEQFPLMRERVLSLAADLDRLDRAGGIADPRLDLLRQALTVLSSEQNDRARRVLELFSDR